ncbi:Glutathione S-transferase [Rhynchospora pubera]|uniref:glutathione transferase n=1 Tax=Rhynchospora pubera TaxID=906938 RepID=A0AAV8EFW1_9POAL|nr:Glutathione S-transferase [Rhynchospora pubera]KAJ4803573.1 Glutathione S-transferase [Rhynchospora pubera]
MASEGHEIKLIGAWPSPFVLRVRIALNLKKLSYEMLEETFKKSELLLKSNPVYKKMPVLIHDGKPICESMIIVEYIDETWTSDGVSILPSDSYDRAIARFWTAYIDDKIPYAISKLRPVVRGSAQAEVEAEKLVATLQVLEEAFEKCSKGQSFFGGVNIGYLDIALGSCLAWIKALEKMVEIKILIKEKIPGLVAWSERFCAHDAVREVMPQTDKMVEFAKVLLSVMATTPAN